jgi:hypothetical protein
MKAQLRLVPGASLRSKSPGMNLTMPSRRRFHPGLLCRRLGLLLGTASLISATALFLSWHQDEVALRQQAMAITEHLGTDSARIREVNNWVYHNKGFAPNDRYFIVPALGPTPIQVMEQGGDCSDKSRLVAAMLNSLGIDAGLVMISPCFYCGFVHTVVEARYEHGRMVVDPIWNIDYPAGDGRFLGVTDLAGTNLGQERVVELRNQRGKTDKITVMPAVDATFDYAVSMNWERDNVTRTFAEMLRAMGYQPEALFRPRLLEDPKLSLMLMLIGAATPFALCGYLLDLGLRSVRKQTPRRKADADPAADKLGAS